MTHPDSLRWKATLDTLDSIAEGRNISISNPLCYYKRPSLLDNLSVQKDFFSKTYEKDVEKTCGKCEYLGVKRTLGLFIYGYFCTIKGADGKTSSAHKDNKACYRFRKNI